MLHVCSAHGPVWDWSILPVLCSVTGQFNNDKKFVKNGGPDVLAWAPEGRKERSQEA